MKSKQLKAVFGLALAVLLCVLSILPASANSGPRHWLGTDATGTVLTEGECPLTVEHETLTFDIWELPSTYYSYAEEFLAYDASVTAEYTFYNPTDMTVSANLLFPYGILPDYAFSAYDPDTGEYIDYVSSDKYGVLVDGQAVNATVRYSYAPSFYNFDPTLEMAKLHDGYDQSGFLTPDLPVHVYTYVISGVDDRTYPSAYAAGCFGYDPERTMVVLEDHNREEIVEDGVQLGISVDDYDRIVLYVFGEDIGAVDWKFYENGALETEIAGQVEAVSRETVTFGELAMQAYDESLGILAHDWYNAIVRNLEEGRWDDTCVYRGVARDWDVSDDLLAWYEYEITLSPGGRLTNTVTAPLYPHIDDSYHPRIYTYTYLLSPASLWADFGTLDIYVNTPYDMVDVGGSIDFDLWQKTDAGYELHLDSLPQEDLVFNVSTDPEPTRGVNAWVILGIIVMVIALLGYIMVPLAIVVLLIAVVLVVLALVIGVLLLAVAVAAAVIIIVVVRCRNKKDKD